MPATPAANHELEAARTTASPATAKTKPKPSVAQAIPPAHTDENARVRLHITPFRPELLNTYLGPSIRHLATNLSFHTVDTFPEKGFGYIELPAMEAQKLKKKLHGSTLKGSKVRVDDAKPEKRKVFEAAPEGDEDRPAKRSRKEKKTKQGVLEGVELEDERNVKRGWTEVPVKGNKDKKDKKAKKDKNEKTRQKDSKYTKEPELLFKAKLTPVAATETARKDKSKDKSKDKKDTKDKKARTKEVHEFENNTKTPSFLKTAPVSTENKAAVEYINGKGWVDEDGTVVEPETSRARNRRALELVDRPTTNAKVPSSASPHPTTEKKPSAKAKKVTPTPPPSEPEDDEAESSVVSSSSEDEATSNAEPEVESSASSPAPAADAPLMVLTPSSPVVTKDVHPLEALFKRPKPPALSTPGSASTSTPAKLAPINTSFSFFENDAMDVDGDASGNPPITPFTQKDLEWRGLRSAAPTPDTAAIGRRFSFSWRKGSHEVDDDDDDENTEAGKQLSNNTKANASSMPDLIEEQDEDEDDEDEPGSGEEESEWQKSFWENRGENNRAWKKRRRDTLKVKRLRDNKKSTGGRRI
ncbi:hypothetical protein P154DRAFT_481178 [Amniculicola lignicola CBS 123094]|uniref:Uncharacterized protein n=1 Tax=Amniculicola lignicola CBS 123094 TaxID=1392246 RepID=A0A6A5WZG3_9PLEO|nr:hypothetical protein P154DRAFT_481178 [Amniculicola lignicola CBS 123094]